MIDLNSNCSRVDTVKAMANQMKIQSAAPRGTDPSDATSRKVRNDLQALDEHIKAGDAKKAEAALEVVRKDLETKKSEEPSNSARREQDAIASLRALDSYA